MNSDNLQDEKMKLQLRLFEIGKDNLHGKQGLPGVQKYKNNIGLGKSVGGSKKLLRPANKPFKVAFPPNPQMNQNIQNMNDPPQNRIFAEIDEVQQLQDEQILPKNMIQQIDQNLLYNQLDKQRFSQIRPDSFRGPQRNTFTITESQQSSFTPRILTLNEISQKSTHFKVPIKSQENDVKTRNLSISKSALNFQAHQNADSSANILQKHITDNPQYQQQINVAPYLKQTRDFVIQKQQFERKLQSALSVHQNSNLIEQKSIKNLVLQSIDKNQMESFRSKPTNSIFINQVVTSQHTGIQTQLPLGPSMNTTRSISKSRFDKNIQHNEEKIALSRQSIQNIKSAHDKISEQNPSQYRLNTQRNLIPSISMQFLKQQSLKTSRQDGPIDPRVQKIQDKLKNDQQNAKQYFDYVNEVQKSNSRQNIVPGKQEQQDEIIRQQILVGKLRQKNDIHRNVMKEQNLRQERDNVDLKIHLKSSGFSSRNIPQILSDQQSQISSIVNQTQRDQQSMSDTFQNQNINMIYKMDSESRKNHLGHHNQDYKPNDHFNIEDAELINQNHIQNQFQNNQNSIQIMNPEPEPEQINARPKSQLHFQQENQIESQEFLEKLVFNIQNRIASNTGFYIYLRQNELNKQNPYDLVPFNPIDKIDYKRNENTFNLLINQRQQSSSSQMKNYEKSKILKIGKKTFKSKYHNDNQDPIMIKNFTSSNLKSLVQKDSLHPPQIILRKEKYFTLSKQGITSFVNDAPVDFLKIEDWLAERAQFKQIKEKKFFKKFRLWKIIRMWRRNIIAQRRNEVSANLRAKLFKVDEVFGKILLSHRIRCKELENYRIIDMNQQNRDPYTVAGFQQKQHDVREYMKLQIIKASQQTALMFKSGIQETIEILRENVYRQEEFDQKEEMIQKLDQNNQSRGNQLNIGDTQLMKMIQKIDNSSQQSNTDPVYEQLGFKQNLKYGARSQLRDACKKFLRFAFLLDFVSMESLTNVVLLSIQDFIEKIHLQVTQPIVYELEIDNELQNEKKKDKKKNKDEYDYSLKQFPLFHADCIYRESRLPDEMKIVEFVEKFELPPLGKSTRHDFNPLVHLELEPEKQDDSDENTFHTNVEQSNESVKYEFHRYKNLYQTWLTITPDKQDLVQILIEQFQLGFDCLRNFEKWACNAELKPYDNVLEPWDYRSYEKWEPPIEINDMYLNCDDWLQEKPEYIHLEENIEILINKAIKNIDHQLKQIEPLLQHYWINKRLGDFHIVKNDRLKNPIDSLTFLLERFVEQKKIFNEAIPQQKDLGLLKINFDQLKEALTPQPVLCIKKLKNVIPKMVKTRIEQSRSWMEEQIKKLKIQPQNVDEFIAQIQSLEYIQDNFQGVKDQIDLNNQISKICERFDLFSREDKQNRFIDEAYYLITILNNAIYDTKDKVDNRKDMIKKKIVKKIPKLNSKVEMICKEIFDDKYLRIDKSQMDNNLLSIQNIDKQFQELVIKKKKIQLYQKTMDIGVIEPFNNIEESKIALQARLKLWTSINSWSKNIEIWRTQPFDQIDVEYILEQASLQSKIVLQCERILPQPCESVKYLKDLVFEFKETMPIIEALGNKLLEDIHWEEIKEKLGMMNFPLEEKQFSLGELVNYGVAKYSEDVVNISVTATQEYNILNQINQLKETWKTVDFDLQPYRDKDAFILVDVDKIQAVLDESMQISSSIISSRYVKRLIELALDMHEKLNLISETLEQWRETQKNWLYLQSIFQSQDIRKQRLKDFQDFEMINKQWIKLMKQTNVKRNVRFQCTQNRQRLQDFLRWNAVMEKIQKNLEEYLEEKRSEFPRFYFISNDELLRVLASSADLHIIEKLISKCFENLSMFLLKDELIKEQEMLEEKRREEKLILIQQQSLKNLEDPKSPMTSMPSTFEVTVPLEQYDHYDHNDIFGIKSTEKENLKFVKILKIRGQGIEVWMKILDEYIQTALQKHIKDSYKQFYDESEQINRNQWVLKNLSQSVSVVSQIAWTEGTEIAFNEMQDENPFAIEDFFDIIKTQLNQLTQLIIGNLTSIQRKVLVALITQDVHARDIIEEIKLKNVQSVNDFIWQKQLRYYFEEEQVIIKQANTIINYGYEYLGPTSRLVITPLTDKCWLTITGALNIKLGAQPQGPAGTGKTESTKDLAKAVGIYCVVVNCSDQIEYQTTAKHFSGVIQSGSWTCLDEFNRINIEVLSVIAQQLLDIKIAKSKGKERMMFNEKERDLKPQCGIFITMNPGYAGRQELPDNLKVLFRPVSMMIPNYGLIAEIMLFAEGFQEARALSKKMVQLYKLASEQLSQQDHYDFGLRAVKSVLVMAGNLKRQNPDLYESTVLIRAMRDSNVPKFLSSDLPLFQAIIQDLFPGIQIPQSKYQILEQEIDNSFSKMKLRQSDVLSSKVIQLFETLLVRFGVMIVGPAGGGKTTIYKLLSESLSSLNQVNSKEYNSIKYKILNPKSISMGELYGEENLDTKEWTDGLASKILRKFSQPLNQDQQKWCVFDGPVDAIWIENMNTVLDDNMTLCLVSGERIKLNNSIRILFEVQDLAQASPATVSRCGMVYVTPSDIGWKPYYDSWKQNYLTQYLDQEKLDFIENLFVQYVDLAFQKLDKYKQKEIIQTIPLQNVQCLCNFIEHFIQNRKMQDDDKKDIWMRQINSIFGFSMIWSFGVSYDQPTLRYLDSIFRDFFPKIFIPQKDTVFQYFWSEKEFRFKHWNEIIDEFQSRIEYPYDSLFVPTVDSISYTKILNYLMGIKKKVFITGATGVGKSILIQEYIQINQEQYSPIQISFSAQTSSVSVQKSIESKLVKKRGKKIIGINGNQQCLIFIDDINMPKVEQYGAQPPIEFLRLLIDSDIIYDRPTFFKKKIDQYQMICAAAPPGGGRAQITQRFMRHFHLINLPTASEEILTEIFDTIIKKFLDTNMFSDDVVKCGNIAVAATIDMFTQFNKKMLPIPSRFHYQFNLRDVSRVIQGILMSRTDSIPNSKIFAKLWVHECQRVFHDRLVDEFDRQFFKDLSIELLNVKFKEKLKIEDLFYSNLEEDKIQNTFSMILKCDSDQKFYEEIQSPKKLIDLLQNKIIDYNFTFSQQQMNLIFFEDAIDHICRITRVLNQPKGNSMLIGVSGCGKQSLTKLSSFLLEAPCRTIKIQKNYKYQSFRDDIKEMMLSTGCIRKPSVFLLADTQIINEQFLEDVNCILNTGEISELYKKEDFDKIAQSLENFMKEKKIIPSSENIYQTFIQQIQLYFHVILTMSPVGDLLRIRCRNFPSLVNCCTIDWFNNWPEQALQTVSEQYFQANEMIKDDPLARKSFTQIFPKIHHGVDKLTQKFYQEQKRHVYITPKSFLDALSLFREQLQLKNCQVDDKYQRLTSGVEKLDLTNIQIKELQITLTELVPKLLQEQQSANEQAEIIKEQTQIAREREYEAELEVRRVQHETKQVQKLKDEAESLLNKAKPALLASEKAISELSKDDINELKKVNNPVPAVLLALECTLIYLGFTKLDWSTAQKALADMKFLDKLKTYDRNQVPENIFNKVNNIISKNSFDIEKMTKASKAAGGLARWCKAIRDYSESLTIVRPRQAKLQEMTIKLQGIQEKCARQEEEVMVIKKNLDQLQQLYQNTIQQIENLKNDKLKCESRLENASKLLNLLSSEGERWRQEILVTHDQKRKLSGDVLLSSAQMSYLGPFTGNYRKEILQEWIQIFSKFQIEFSEDFSLVKTIGDPIEIRKWKINGLPNDSVSIDNAIFTMKSQSWPILIDPQQQANQWLKKMYKPLNTKTNKNQFNVTKIQYQQDLEKSQSTQFQQIMELSIKNGSILLIEDMSQEIDPTIEQIASKAVFKEQGLYKIKIGDKTIEYNKNFKLFFTTKISNPHFLPEVSIKLAVINFTVTFDGLDEQLLSETVKNLEPEVERLRDQLIIQISQIQNQQQLTQQQILTALAESNKDTILDNFQLIETLAISKVKSVEISESLLKSESIEATVQEKREQYREVSNRGSILYFVIASLSSVDPMYQNSLTYFLKIYNDTIKSVIKTQNLQKTQENFEIMSGSLNRSNISIKEQSAQKSVEQNFEEIAMESFQSGQDSLVNESQKQQSIKNLSFEQIQVIKQELIQQITLNSYIDICRGLFEAHKIIFSFVISISIQKNQGLIDEQSYSLLLRGQGIYDKSNQPNYFQYKFIHEFFSEQQWELAYCMQIQLKQYFSNLLQDILDNYFEFKTLLLQDDKNLENAFEFLPSRFKTSLPLFQQLILIKLLKPQLLVDAIKQYVVISLGKQYSISPITYIEEVFASSDKTTPIIFVLSPGADPNEQILQYAKKVRFEDKVFQKSLGQGQEKVATQLVNIGQKYGHWVLLQNCHLFKSWMPQLEALCDNIRENVQSIHYDFRLILTSEPKDYFPSAVLQNGIKITTEPPKGLKQNLKRITQTVLNEDMYNLQEKELSVNNNSIESQSKSIASIQIKKQEEPIDIFKDKRFDLLKCWKSMIYGLCFFHSVIQERKKFGSIGWNIMYEFNNSDLETSIKMLQKFITENEDIPWDAIQFMTGHINYGGRVTDDNDRLLLMCILEKCYGEQILDASFIKQVKGQKKKLASVPKREYVEFSFFDSKLYQIPKENETLQNVYQYIDQLPDYEEPLICGLHPNAIILNQIYESKSILKTILNIQMQPVISQNQEKSTLSESINSQEQEDDNKQKVTHQDQQVLVIANELYQNRPLIISLEERSKDILKQNSKGLLSCYSIVLLQEQERYNKLILVVQNSLEQLIKAIQGQVLMSQDLDEMYSSFLKNQVPQNWQRISYSSLKPLASWFKNLHQRIEFMRKWMMKGHPTAYWLQGFFFPHGFMTGILQTYARKHQKAIDFLKFKYLFSDLNQIKEFITKDKSDFIGIDQMDRIQQQPEDGVYIFGLYIESAKWNNSSKCLAEQDNKATISIMPVIHFLPFEIKHEIFIPQPQIAPDQDQNQKKDQKLDRENLETSLFQGEEDEDLNNPQKYLCPLYKTSQRAGALSTTGQSTNYILSISLPINKKESNSDHWILRGAALLTMRDD